MFFVKSDMPKQRFHAGFLGTLMQEIGRNPPFRQIFKRRCLPSYSSYPNAAQAGLRVYVAKADYLLTMKLRAMRVGSRDEADAVLLAQASRTTTFEAMIALLNRYFPKEPPDVRRAAIIRQFAESLNAPPSDNTG